MQQNLGIGSTIKKIRTGKLISQSTVCQSSISRTTLSKIENNKSSPSWRTIQKILDPLDISIAELEFLIKRENPKERIIRNFWSITDNTNTKDLENIINECNEYGEQSALVNDIKILAEVFTQLPNIPNEKINCISKVKISSIWHRLNRMNMWTLNELKLASCCLFYFPLETSICIAQRIMEEIEKYREYQNIEVQCFIAMLYLNLCSLFCSNSNLSHAEKMNTFALDLFKKIKRYDLYYFCMVRAGIFSKQENLIKEGLSFLEKFDKAEYILQLKQEMKLMLNK